MPIQNINVLEALASSRDDVAVYEPESLYDDVQLTLENDGRFYKWCLTRLGGLRSESVTEVHWKHTLKYFYPPAGRLTPRERATMRRYFYERWINPERKPNKLQEPSPLSSLTATPMEKPMSTKLTFRPQFLLNGMPLEQFTKEAVYEAIAAEEKRIAKLREIQHQPKSLVKEIEDAEAALTALVEHLDAI